MSRTQPERSAATQAALVAAARKLWAERGYAAVGTPEIATAAGVTRGAMYHQYADKAALFAAVIEAVEADAMRRLSTAVAAARPASPAEAMHAAANAWLEIAAEPEVRQIVLLDAPVVLGPAGFRELNQRYGLGITEQLLAGAIDAGQLTPQPVRPLAALLLAAIDEAAMVVAVAEDPSAARIEVRAAVRNLLDGILRDPASGD
ncbi:TetR/AcrR family transcriptional regulator [Labedaea rhizosphaerae]|uniref:TetR family transcriptional regulator n=1 Tax=Labedaea rhizosphaerae TaxID=598644 RepID=A0A4R6S9G9_LABRH|nr:TetR/AcrR family transcriptional regulator [Labedaea rhizosphaerae]TDP96441.1 TetR family transcriptional regulator [Labedaea rhizosphaerae]